MHFLINPKISPKLRRSRLSSRGVSSEPATGSREQLCDDVRPIKDDVKQLLERSRQKTPIRASGYDPR